MSIKEVKKNEFIYFGTKDQAIKYAYQKIDMLKKEIKALTPSYLNLRNQYFLKKKKLNMYRRFIKRVKAEEKRK